MNEIIFKKYLENKFVQYLIFFLNNKDSFDIAINEEFNIKKKELLEDTKNSYFLKCVNYLLNFENEQSNIITFSENDIIQKKEEILNRFITDNFNDYYIKFENTKITKVDDFDSFFSKPEIHAIISYRFISLLIQMFMKESEDSYGSYEFKVLNKVNDFKTKVRFFSERIRHQTAIDINPFAKIGKNLNIEFNNIPIVIGERCRIGDNCTIQENVVLGVNTKNENILPKDRHPYLGDNVKIMKGSRILGSILIGSNTTIKENCIITENIPEGSVVYNNLEMQVYSNKSNGSEKSWIYTIIKNDDKIKILGDNLYNLTPKLLNLSRFEEESIDINCFKKNNDYIEININFLRTKVEDWYLALVNNNDKIRYLIKNSIIINNIKNNGRS